ncbi:antitoxin Xre/MbcA/ParS toxin-binding domain-containing protein [uncultured Sphingomonas sp.]|uniref:antitoxin Xre/MbcA/ParS toxin-binding domain-containing protein n=1 Tax=unclassified Sphingomonas TaxID=196159 RepID=UPI0025E154AB|nr:antitoxin Xre/MbcA/ParS toxin-binding domain-containing protein [uncultured Sphingomonas sp.]
MSAETTDIATSAEAAPIEPTEDRKPMLRRRQFRPAAVKSKLSADEADRQGRAVRLAFEVLGRDAARAFLNEPHDTLGGRPLDIATQSADGMLAVEDAINRHAAA